MVIINRELKFKKILLLVGIFLLGYVSVALLWYIRAYIISGNPIFPILNTLFIKESPLVINGVPKLYASEYISFNWEMFAYQNLVMLSPFFFIGILSLIFLKKAQMYAVAKSQLFILLLIFTLEQLFIRVAWGRYLLLWFLISSVFVSSGIVYLIQKNKLYKYGIHLFFSLFFVYYFINTLFVLPYGFGWADKNAYLTRVLARDNTSYYDFDRQFDKWIKQNDFVATYGFNSFYYANFKHTDVGYIFEEKSQSFDLLKKKGVTLLLINGGDIKIFCKELALRDCDKSKVKLLASYPKDLKKYNLYSIVLPHEK